MDTFKPNISRFTLRLNTNNELDAELSDYLLAHEKGHSRSEVVRTLAKIGFNCLVKNLDMKDSLHAAISPEVVNSMVIALANSAHKKSDDVGVISDREREKYSSLIKDLELEISTLKRKYSEVNKSGSSKINEDSSPDFYDEEVSNVTKNKDGFESNMSDEADDDIEDPLSELSGFFK